MARGRRKKDGLDGTTFVERLGKWRAQINIDGVRRHLGCFASEEAAHAAYLEARESNKHLPFGPKPKVRPHRVSADVVEVFFDNGRVALLDLSDYARLSHLSMSTSRSKAQNSAYVQVYGPGHPAQLLHRIILEPPLGMVVDHINGNGLDNRRSNLRLCSRSENLMNQGPQQRGCGLKGASFSKGKWVAQIMARGRYKYLGRYATKELAHAAYVAASKELHGEFARHEPFERNERGVSHE